MFGPRAYSKVSELESGFEVERKLTLMMNSAESSVSLWDIRVGKPEINNMGEMTNADFCCFYFSRSLSLTLNIDSIAIVQRLEHCDLQFVRL